MKKKQLQYVIPLSTLKNGEHAFHFMVDKTVFAENQFDDIHEASLKADISFNKNSTILMLNFDINGAVNVTCDRCGDDFDMLLALKRQLIVKTECREHQEEDDMVSLSSDESDFDAAPYIYQYVVLSLPMQRMHALGMNGKSECNSETLKKLNNIHVETSNEEQYILNSNKRFSHKEDQMNN